MGTCKITEWCNNSICLDGCVAQLAIDAATKAEREACAKVCDEVRAQDARGGNDSYLEGRQMGATVCKNTILMRSNR